MSFKLDSNSSTNRSSNNSGCCSGKDHQVIRTFDQFLEKKGYKLYGTIGTGSYAKVKYKKSKTLTLFSSLKDIKYFALLLEKPNTPRSLTKREKWPLKLLIAARRLSIFLTNFFHEN
jgi:hypothetical protein